MQWDRTNTANSTAALMAGKAQDGVGAGKITYDTEVLCDVNASSLSLSVMQGLPSGMDVEISDIDARLNALQDFLKTAKKY